MNKKQAAGERAAQFVQDGMTIGLGTGSTAYYATMKIGELVAQGLSVVAIPTSRHTEQLAQQLNIPVTTFADVSELDLTIDGADAVTPELDLIKGGGGALLREKLVAAASNTLIIVADDSKLVQNFAGLSIPIEIVTFAWESTFRKIECIGGKPTLRKVGDRPFVTDNANYIVDTVFDHVEPRVLHQNLKSIVGVVETGLFPGMASRVIVAREKGVEVIDAAP